MHHNIATGYLLNSNVFLMNSKTLVMQLPSHVAMAASSRAVFSSICLYHSRQHGCTITQNHHSLYFHIVYHVLLTLVPVQLLQCCHITWQSHDITWPHMTSHDTATDNVLTWPSKIRLMVSGMEGVFHLLAFSFCKEGRKAMMSSRSSLI